MHFKFKLNFKFRLSITSFLNLSREKVIISKKKFILTFRELICFKKSV